jgi:glycosyltransferase involved in cell wall biosynthesis
VRICYISSGYLPALGGVERHVSELARRMAAAGHVVEVVAQTADGRLAPTERIEGVVVRRYLGRSVGGAVAVGPALWRYVAAKRSSFDILHAQNYHALPALAGFVAPGPHLVVTPHYLGGGGSGLLALLHTAYRPLGGLPLRRAARIVCVSHTEAAMLRRDFSRLSTPITVIPNGVDVAGLRTAERKDLATRVVLSAGRLEGYKNFAAAICAMSHVPEAFGLFIAGDGPHRMALERLTRDLALERRVRFLGQLTPRELNSWMRTADVYVNLSPRECFGITVLEAMVAGAAVVASNIPAHREVLGSAGDAVAFLPPDADAPAVAAAIRRQASVPRTGEAPDVATWDDVAERHLGLYWSLRRAGV